MIEASQSFSEDVPMIEASQDDPMIEASQSSLLQNEDISQLENSTMLQSRMRKRNRNYTIREYDEDSTSFDGNVDNDVDNDVNNNDDDNNNDDNNNDDDKDDDDDVFEDYSSPDYNIPDNFNDLQNISEEWIIIFILRFQTRFRLPDTAIDTLIKFVKHVLTKLDSDQFENFPTSLYTARKKLGLKHQFVTFSVCPSCHKLHNVNDVEQHIIQEQKAIKKCDHIQFPNNRCRSL